MGEPGFFDLYEALQLSPNATGDTVERVYRMLAKRYHPDNQETGDARRFADLHRAYDTLGDLSMFSIWLTYGAGAVGVQTGLDHVLFLLEPGNDKSWQALEGLLPEDLFVTVHITLNQQNAKGMHVSLERLAGIAVKNISVSIMDMSLRPELDDLAQKAADLNLTMRFDLPVPYSEQDPVALETRLDDVPSGAGNAWLYVEPDGDVLPSQGMAGNVLGNFLRDPWETIYSRS